MRRLTLICFGCGKTGHQISACPVSSVNVSKPIPSGVQRKAVHSNDADESNPTDEGAKEESVVETRNEETVVEEHEIDFKL